MEKRVGRRGWGKRVGRREWGEEDVEKKLVVVIFLKYNTPLPSSASVERLFSFGSDILRPKRSSLTSHNFEQLVFMKGNISIIKKNHKLQEEEEEENEEEME